MKSIREVQGRLLNSEVVGVNWKCGCEADRKRACDGLLLRRRRAELQVAFEVLDGRADTLAAMCGARVGSVHRDRASARVVVICPVKR